LPSSLAMKTLVAQLVLPFCGLLAIVVKD